MMIDYHKLYQQTQATHLVVSCKRTYLAATFRQIQMGLPPATNIPYGLESALVKS